MAALARTGGITRRADARPKLVVPTTHEGAARLEATHRTLLSDAERRAEPFLKTAYRFAVAAYRGSGSTDAADRVATGLYVGNVVASLAAEGELDAVDAQIAVDTLAQARGEPREAAAFDLYRMAAASPFLLELPPLVAAELQLKLLVQLGIASEISLWRGEGGNLEPFVVLGHGAESRRARATARAALRRGGTLSLVGGRALRSVVVRRFTEPCAAIVARVQAPVDRVDAFLTVAAQALTPVLERELLLERSAERERILVSAGEQRLMRIGFDLHDGAIQDVLALGADITHLRDQIYPFIVDSHRDRATGRFDDLLARVVELDRQLRELSRSLESRSIVSRPLGEILHREVDAFIERSGIDATLEIRGDPESLTSAQRIAVYRAIQESLSNVKEHSGASTVEIRLRMRRSSIEVRVVDDGQGFEVGRALARAAQRGRLGIVGIGERVRMLGGSFEIDSAPGGPTMLTFALPRVVPDDR
jgi:signal transduction histidine kinase